MRIWNKKPINESGEALREIPSSLFCIEPHPYFSQGAPYPDVKHPWYLREGVIKRLVRAQEFLQIKYPDLRFGIFDAWRPVPVQAFMVELVISQECLRRGLNPDDMSNKSALKELVNEIEGFWASPCLDPKLPPPHSTGGAVDITLIDLNDAQLDMGSSIDEIGSVSLPDYYLEAANENPETQANVWHQRRCVLFEVLRDQGFARHPKEWWHFSYGDQMWAWNFESPTAIYGRSDFLT